MESQKNEVQKDLFEGYSSEGKRSMFRRKHSPGHRPVFVISYERLTFISIAGILAIVVVFALGVERGKRVSQAPVIPQPADLKVVTEVNGTEEEAVEVKIAINEVFPGSTDVSAEEAKPPEIAVPASGPYTVQLVAYKNKQDVENEMKYLVKSGYKPFLIPSGKFSQVCVGEYATNDEAKKTMQELKTKYKECFTRRR